MILIVIDTILKIHAIEYTILIEGSKSLDMNCLMDRVNINDMISKDIVDGTTSMEKLKSLIDIIL